MSEVNDRCDALSLSRRNLLKLGLSVPVMSLLPLSGVLMASAAAAEGVFSAAEEAHVTYMVHDIIPEDADAGAAQTGTAAHTLGYFASLGPLVVAQVKAGIGGMNMVSQAMFGQDMIYCDAAQREQVYAYTRADAQLAPFWLNVRAVAVLHFYAQPLGYEQAGLPGPSVDEERFFNADQRSLRLCGQQNGI